MDTLPFISAHEAARRLGTTVPRIKRALARLDLDVEMGPNGRVRMTEAELERLRAELGAANPLLDLTRSEARVLAALARSPMGVSSARVAAARAGVSPTTASRTLRMLRDKGLVTTDREWVAAGRARELEVTRANVASDRWPALAPQLARITSPNADRPEGSSKVPTRLHHLFWNTAPAQLEVNHAGGYIARRLISAGDLEGLAWGVDHLSAEDWRHAARTRGLDPEQRAMAANLALQAAR